MSHLYILYDAGCAMCRRCREWLLRQPAYLELRFIPLQSAEVDFRFPGVAALKPEQQLVVIDDLGGIYQGAKAWIMCLYALREYREWSFRLASPALMPSAGKVIELISNNRKDVSRWFHAQPDEELARNLAAAQANAPSRGGCALPPPIPRAR